MVANNNNYSVQKIKFFHPYNTIFSILPIIIVENFLYIFKQGFGMNVFKLHVRSNAKSADDFHVVVLIPEKWNPNHGYFKMYRLLETLETSLCDEQFDVWMS